MLRQSPPREQKTPTGPRISDLAAEEPVHPLVQHLPFPMNVNAPQASPPHDYLTFDMQRPDIGRRRATLPSVPSASIQRHSFDESRGRLSTWEERLEDDSLPSPGIGIALSSPTQAMTPTRNKRRSRSADALFELVKGRESIDRGRSGEIRHWRESYMSGSIYSRPQTAKTVETIQTVPIQEATIQEPKSESVLEMSATLLHADEPETPEHEQPEPNPDRVVHAPVSAFNFGNLQNERLEEERILDVPAEAPVPPTRSQNRLPMEDRIQHLESAYENLEGSIRRISTRNNRQTVILETAPKSLRTRNRSSSTRSISASRSRSTPSIHQEPLHQSSSDTLNPGLPSPVLAQPNVYANNSSDTDDATKQALKSLFEALKYERGARKALEQQVRTLHHDIADLHALVNKLIVSATATSPTSYPTPSPDTLIISSTEEQRLRTPRPEHSAGGYGGGLGARSHAYERSETESESEYEDGGMGKVGGQTPDVWATPKEEGFGGSGFFSGEERMRGYA